MHSVFSATLTLDDQILYCLLASMAATQAEDVRASLLFGGDLNNHHQEWLDSTTTNRHGAAAFDFATVSGCDQLVVCPTYACGGTLDLLMTDVPDLVQVAVIAPIGNSSLSTVISMDQTVSNLCVIRKFYLKNQFNWNAVCGAIQDLPWHNIWSADNPVEVLNEHLSLLVLGYVPTKVIRVLNKDKPWFDDQCIHDRTPVYFEAFDCCQVRANETYFEAKRQFSVRNRNVLMNA